MSLSTDYHTYFLWNKVPCGPPEEQIFASLYGHFPPNYGNLNVNIVIKCKHFCVKRYLLSVSLILFSLPRCLPMITVSGPWMRRTRRDLLVSSSADPVHIINNTPSLQYHLNRIYISFVQVRRWCSSALGKVFSTTPSRATTPVSLPMDKLVTYNKMTNFSLPSLAQHPEAFCIIMKRGVSVWMCCSRSKIPKLECSLQPKRLEA